MNRIMWEAHVRDWLLDDLGRAGDITTDAIVPADLGCTARMVAREPGVVAGLAIGTADHQGLARGRQHHGRVGVHQAHRHPVGGLPFALTLRDRIGVIAQELQQARPWPSRT